MSGEQVIIVPGDEDPGAEFAAGVAVATADQAAETASSAEHTAELALQVAQDAADTAHVALGAVDNELEDDMSKAELDAFKEETSSRFDALFERLDALVPAAASEEEPAGPPAPAPKDDEGQEDGPVATPEQDGDDEGTPAATTPKPKRKGRSYGARRWFGDDDDE